ncbi:hypothetical protein [Tessaracoccus sp. ZS01]|uniref:hypothetical protein n=1 Tax=Tessaracoccus sp. ZS01 TaxID=1906324 RepID=UPI00096F22AC|nr:hypothetical protein [Tessaracoccus sp. ZS01]MCG6568311.1 hypothetical protein [Tessaracoccus sp. ZS01]OMG53400.1 hypothetical protein BJN44_11880 [Tessaracoccus sp. ZS01]
MTRRISRSALATAVLKSAAWAGITLIDPNRLSGWKKHAYWLAMAGGTAAEVALPDDGTYRPAGLSTGLALGTAGVTYGAQDLLARSDAWSIKQLQRLGIKRPRLWAAVGVFASMMAVSLAQGSEPAEEDADGFDEFGQPLPETLEPLPAEVRAVITALLDAVDDYGSEELRVQLEDAVCRDEDGHFLLVPDPEAPPTLLDSYTFPASATFTRDGATHVLMLDIEDGQLSYLSHMMEPYPEDDADVDWSLPEVSELRVIAGLAAAD